MSPVVTLNTGGMIAPGCATRSARWLAATDVVGCAGCSQRRPFRSSAAPAAAGVPDSRNGALIDAGTSVTLGTHGRAFFVYDGTLTDTRTEHGLQAGLQIAW